MHKIRIISGGAFAGFCFFAAFMVRANSPVTGAADPPRIVNIVNFIRLLEPRDPRITEDVLYQTVVRQIGLMRKYRLGGTFLLQYDALMDRRYQRLLKRLPKDSFEIGAWWELPQPLVEKAGLPWRGRYPWDWRANIGFATGYTPKQRERLADAYMQDFRKVFGYYPRSVGCWFIDAYTLNYLYTKYGIVASCNCKDQYGTDGYTLWGGYWNQAYYPSKVNSYMPAQDADRQIPVPIFRMLGSDPVRQYDNGLGSDRQGVATLEPVYKQAGGDSTWVDWFFRQFTAGEPLAFAYTQAGQENSFTWDAMARGLSYQLPLIARLRDEKKIEVETLAQSGKWFRKHFKLTPATAVVVDQDLPGSDRRTIWFDSRFYRANLLWEKGTLRFRDIHLFDEKLVSPYLRKKADADACAFFTLPFVDGYLWSAPPLIAGLRLMSDGDSLLEGGIPVITGTSSAGLTAARFDRVHVVWPLRRGGRLVMDLGERQIRMTVEGRSSVHWFLDLTAADKKTLPFTAVDPHRVSCSFQGLGYEVRSIKGVFSKPGGLTVLRIVPESEEVILEL